MVRRLARTGNTAATNTNILPNKYTRTKPEQNKQTAEDKDKLKTRRTHENKENYVLVAVKFGRLLTPTTHAILYQAVRCMPCESACCLFALTLRDCSSSKTLSFEPSSISAPRSSMPLFLVAFTPEEKESQDGPQIEFETDRPTDKLLRTWYNSSTLDWSKIGSPDICSPGLRFGSRFNVIISR